MKQGRRTSVTTVCRYIRLGEVFADNAAVAPGL
jgi:hypothetical protein